MLTERSALWELFSAPYAADGGTQGADEPERLEGFREQVGARMAITSTHWPIPVPDAPALAEVDAPPDSELPVRRGDVLSGRYAVDRILAAGGMGVVCLGRHVELEQPVAIKFLRRELSQNRAVVQRFLNEAKAAASLRSEHVVRVIDVAEHESGRPYLVMEHLDGLDLGTLVEREGPIHPSRATGYVLDVCAALAEAHAAGIVHRDIKPENLILCTVSGREVVKVVDFGLAKRIDSAQAKVVTNPGEGMGSPCYMSPEQIATPHAVDARTDIWSLGVVLYRLVSGWLPFDGDSLSEVCARVLNAVPRPLTELLPRLDGELDAIVRRCLQKNREDRFASIDELTLELRRYRGAAFADTQLASVTPPTARMSSDAPTALDVPKTPVYRVVAPVAASILAFVLVGGALGAYAGGGVSRLRDLADVRLADGPSADDRVNGLRDHPRRRLDVSSVAPGVYAVDTAATDGVPSLLSEREVKQNDEDDDSAEADSGPSAADDARREDAEHARASRDDASPSPEEASRRERRYRRYLDRHGYTPIREVLERIEHASASASDHSAAAADPPPASGSESH